MRLAFMGTPDFAAQSLRALLDAGFEVAVVFTQPDRPKGRGMRSGASPVAELAGEKGLPVYRPESLRTEEAGDILRSYEPDLTVVVAYGKILPVSILELPPLGTVNLHASLLPEYRGAAPIQRAVLNGDAETGVTTMYIAADLDSGDIIYSEKTAIGEYETSGELFGRLAGIGAELLVRTVGDIEKGCAPRIPQDDSRATYAPRIDRSMSPVNWSLPPRGVVKQICGLDPWPGAVGVIDGAELKIWRAEYTGNTTEKLPGSIVSAGREGIEIACGEGETVMIKILQPPGKKRMKASDWILGHPLPL